MSARWGEGEAQREDRPMSDLMEPVRIARGGRSFDLAGFRVRVEAGRHDPRVEDLIQFMVAAITEKQQAVDRGNPEAGRHTSR